MTKVVYSVIAQAELRRLSQHITRESGATRAAAVVMRIRGSLLTVATFPNAGRASSADGARRFSISPWVVIYRALPDGDGIYVLRIVDGRRDLSDIL